VSAISYSGTGTAAINSDNARINYTPAANFNGTDTITYTVSDGNGGTDTATLTITVSAVNDAPTVGVVPTMTTPTDTDLTIDLVTDYVTDEESNAVISAIAVSAGSGSVSLSSDSLSMTYTPASGFTGSTSISYTLNDGTTTLSGTIAVSVVNPVVTSACSPSVGLGASACSITPTNHRMQVLAFGLCTTAPSRPTSSTAYDISSCQMIYDGRSSGGVSVAVAGNSSVNFGSDLTVPAYGTYTHGIVLVDNAFTVQGELTLSSGATPYCYITSGMNVICYAAPQTAPQVTDTITDFFALTPALYSYTFSTDNVSVDLVTSATASSTLASAGSPGDAILAIQTFGSPKTFDSNTTAIDIGVKVSEAVTMTSTTADTAPFSIRFSVQ
ncbi:MAG: cadherin-like domain-containing protein, partial [Candidatus Nanopelagicales bacterium]|nr:cadherin-like domain-containing protein [Candidatus Nanopelagicales bacterium]